MKLLQKSLLFFFFCTALFSCVDGQHEPPGAIQRDTMILVLADMHILESSISLGHINSKKKNIKPESFNSWIFKKHTISKERFDITYEYYTQNPKLFDELYVEVINKLSEIQARSNQ